jgi:hypothetical protein
MTGGRIRSEEVPTTVPGCGGEAGVPLVRAAPTLWWLFDCDRMKAGVEDGEPFAAMSTNS